jgi:hypothetical protein
MPQKEKVQQQAAAPLETGRVAYREPEIVYLGELADLTSTVIGS